MTLVTEKLPNMHYINKGYNGWTSGGIAASIDSLGLTKANVYSVFLGTNDWWQGRHIGTIDDYKSNSGNNTVYGSFRIIIDKLHSLNKNAKIILITPYSVQTLFTLTITQTMLMALTKKRMNKAFHSLPMLL